MGHKHCCAGNVLIAVHRYLSVISSEFAFTQARMLGCCDVKIAQLSGTAAAGLAVNLSFGGHRQE